MIKKRIHYCWFGGGKLSPLNEKCIESWRKWAPDFEIVRWDESNAPINDELSEYLLKKRLWAFLSDYIRLQVLKTHGGVYFDVDIELIRDISPLLGNSAFLGEELPGRLNTAVLGSEASGGYVEACASEMLNRHKNGKSFLIAPELATHVYKTLCNDVTVFSTEHFYPYNPYDSEGVGQLMIADIKENTYAVHHWGKSWNESFIAKLARKAKKIYAA